MIRKIYRQLKSIIGIKKNSDSFIDYFKTQPIVNEVKKLDNSLIAVSFQNFERTFFARNYPHSDLNVLKQVLLENEYKPVVDYLIDNWGISGKLTVIDAGANVGYFSLYIKNFLPTACIACIEPGENNVNVLAKNLKYFIEKGEIKIYNRGLGPVGGRFLKIENNFRGGSDWALTVSESETATSLKSITIQDILYDNQWEYVDVLKIDIEGGERFLFAKDADVSYLKKVKLISLEIHDEFNIREQIYEVLRTNDFLIINYGETTMAVNKKFIP